MKKKVIVYFLVSTIGVVCLMIPAWILENKLDIKFNGWEQLGIIMGLLMGIKLCTLSSELYDKIDEDIQRFRKQ